MLGIILAAVLTQSPACTTATPRNPAVATKFKKQNPCPSTCKTYVRRGSAFKVYEICGACAVDHKCPLAPPWCGPDTVENMRWLDKYENLKKGTDGSLCEVK